MKRWLTAVLFLFTSFMTGTAQSIEYGERFVRRVPLLNHAEIAEAARAEPDWSVPFDPDGDGDVDRLEIISFAVGKQFGHSGGISGGSG